MQRILFASGNQGKYREVAEVSSRYGINLVSPRELGYLGTPPDVDETANTYVGNAILKAETFFRWANLPSLADDTGLEVEALDGAPGLFSARFAGKEAKADNNIEKLLAVLAEKERGGGVPSRRASFIAVLAMATGAGEPLVVEARLHGEIARERRGSGGFGYDSVFMVDGYGKTLAQLKEEGIPVKTHRVLACEALFEKIR